MLVNLYNIYIYSGGLPPHTRQQQALLFNNNIINNTNSDDLHVLIASDAIGMGLNLNIKRIIFSTMEKYNGQEVVQLTSTVIYTYMHISITLYIWFEVYISNI
jgi:ATP-dependent RNA helicase SUPV3L1/SUV3